MDIPIFLILLDGDNRRRLCALCRMLSLMQSDWIVQPVVFKLSIGKKNGINGFKIKASVAVEKTKGNLQEMGKVLKWGFSLWGWSLPLLFDTPLKSVTNALASEISQPEYTGNSLDMALLSGKGLFLKITFFPRYCPPPPTQ